MGWQEIGIFQQKQAVLPGSENEFCLKTNYLFGVGTPTWDWGKSLCFHGFAARIPSGYWGCPLASAQCPEKLSFLFDVEGRTFLNVNCVGEEELLGFVSLSGLL